MLFLLHGYYGKHNYKNSKYYNMFVWSSPPNGPVNGEDITRMKLKIHITSKLFFTSPSDSGFISFFLVFNGGSAHFLYYYPVLFPTGEYF